MIVKMVSEAHHDNTVEIEHNDRLSAEQLREIADAAEREADRRSLVADLPFGVLADDAEVADTSGGYAECHVDDAHTVRYHDQCDPMWDDYPVFVYVSTAGDESVKIELDTDEARSLVADVGWDYVE
jgi:hypothetical protein